MKKLLLTPESSEGTPPGTPSATPSNPNPPGQSPPIAPNPAGHNPAPPATAIAVLQVTKTERELALERELETERGTRKQRETRISELEDQHKRANTSPGASQTQNAPAQKKSFLAGATFFGDEE